jgi:hypothetical protein
MIEIVIADAMFALTINIHARFIIFYFINWEYQYISTSYGHSQYHPVLKYDFT